jgi:probable rRNA maturation factor
MTVSVVVDVNQASPESEAIIVHAVQAALRHLEIAHAAISVTLLDDEAVRDMNQQYLQHDTVTDVISFPLWEEDETPVGDIYIGIQQARRQAEEAGIAFDEELARLAIHGTLHIMHYDHPEEDRTQSEMWQLQEEIVRSL